MTPPIELAAATAPLVKGTKLVVGRISPPVPLIAPGTEAVLLTKAAAAVVTADMPVGVGEPPAAASDVTFAEEDPPPPPPPPPASVPPLDPPTGALVAQAQTEEATL